MWDLCISWMWHIGCVTKESHYPLFNVNVRPIALPIVLRKYEIYLFLWHIGGVTNESRCPLLKVNVRPLYIWNVTHWMRDEWISLPIVQSECETNRLAYCSTAYCIWSVIFSFSLLNPWSSFLGLFYHVSSKRDQGDWDWRLRWNDTPNAIGGTKIWDLSVSVTHWRRHEWISLPIV